MRRWFLFLLIALLPLRGWLGDAMAVEMALAGVAPAAAAHAMHEAATVAPPHCHEAGDASDLTAAADMSTPGHHEAATPHSADCSTCSSCQVCHGAALALVPLLPAAMPQPAAPPAEAPARFASAEPAPAFKPPIG